jgi:hypothetical protein
MSLVRTSTGATAVTVTVFDTGTALDTGKAPCRIQTDSNTTVSAFDVLSGTVSIAGDSISDIAKVTTLAVSGGSVTVNAGVTLTTLDATGGSTELLAGCTTVNQSSGARVHTSGNIKFTTVNLQRATLSADHRYTTGADAEITTLNMEDGSTLDISSFPDTFLITDVYYHGNCRIKVNQSNPSHLTVTNWHPYPGATIQIGV